MPFQPSQFYHIRVDETLVVPVMLYLDEPLWFTDALWSATLQALHEYLLRKPGVAARPAPGLDAAGVLVDGAIADEEHRGGRQYARAVTLEGLRLEICVRETSDHSGTRLLSAEAGQKFKRLAVTSDTVLVYATEP